VVLKENFLSKKEAVSLKNETASSLYNYLVI